MFVALELPATVALGLSAWAQELAAEGVRPVAAADLHVTLCFLGETAAASVDALGEAVAGAVGGAGPVALSVSGGLWLPRRRPRVLAVGVDGPGLGALQARVAAALVAGGWYEPERRPYLGHVTVARVRFRGAGPVRAARGSAAAAGPAAPPGPAGGRGSAAAAGPAAPPGPAAAAPAVAPPALTFAADTVAVVRSHLGSGPARYEPLTRIALSGPPR
ncbi:MAG TPA: RNA 2',3'-cyclic phosphodiesterase [Solirubrobacteraceae bacterium]|nr:RNA 2',3'-cyclic phosphodiesterase [Solirubrobacteraceae bacterium]